MRKRFAENGSRGRRKVSKKRPRSKQGSKGAAAGARGGRPTLTAGKERFASFFETRNHRAADSVSGGGDWMKKSEKGRRCTRSSVLVQQWLQEQESKFQASGREGWSIPFCYARSLHAAGTTSQGERERRERTVGRGVRFLFLPRDMESLTPAPHSMPHKDDLHQSSLHLVLGTKKKSNDDATTEETSFEARTAARLLMPEAAAAALLLLSRYL